MVRIWLLLHLGCKCSFGPSPQMEKFLTPKAGMQATP